MLWYANRHHSWSLVLLDATITLTNQSLCFSLDISLSFPYWSSHKIILVSFD